MTPLHQSIADLIAKGMPRSDIQRKLRCKYRDIDAVMVKTQHKPPVNPDRFQMTVFGAYPQLGCPVDPLRITLPKRPTGLTWEPRQ